MTRHKGPSLAATFSRDGTSEFQRFPRLQVSVHVRFSPPSADCSIKVSVVSMLQQEGRKKVIVFCGLDHLVFNCD